MRRTPKTCCSLCQGEVRPYDTTPTGVRYRCQACGHAFTKPADPRQIKKARVTINAGALRPLNNVALASLL